VKKIKDKALVLLDIVSTQQGELSPVTHFLTDTDTNTRARGRQMSYLEIFTI